MRNPLGLLLLIKKKKTRKKNLQISFKTEKKKLILSLQQITPTKRPNLFSYSLLIRIRKLLLLFLLWHQQKKNNYLQKCFLNKNKNINLKKKEKEKKNCIFLFRLHYMRTDLYKF